MTKKKRELIDILLDNVNPEDWPENLPYAAQDIKSMNVDYPIYAYKQEPVNNSKFPEMWNQSGYSAAVKIGATPKELCNHWNKTIVHRDEFMKRWNERNQVEVKTLTFSREGIEAFTVTESMEKISIKPDDGLSSSFADAVSPLQAQIGGDHYTKLAIQPMQYSMKNGLDPLQHTIIKYVTRFRDKAGIEDLEKAKHCIDMLIEFEKERK